MSDPPDCAGPWLRALHVVLGERRRFGRFITLVLVLSAFTLLAGWLWNAAAIAAASLMLWRHLAARGGSSSGHSEPAGDGDE